MRISDWSSDVCSSDLPGDALTYMLAATGKSLAAVLVGFLIVTAVSRAITGGLRVPQEMGERLPLLESRLNAFIPNILRAVRVVAFLLVVAAILDAWRVTDIGGWLTSPTGQAFIAAVLSAAAVILVSWLIWLRSVEHTSEITSLIRTS